VRDKEGRLLYHVGTSSDITARKEAEAQIHQLAFYDPLTQLPNRRLLIERLQQAFSIGARSGHHGAVLFLDLDRFKVVNDSLGHAAGDQLLITVARRLKQCLRPQDTLSRLGGDEFAILLDQITEVRAARQVADRIRGQLVTTTLLGAVERSPTASIGIVIYGPNYQTAEELLRDADSAMYHAKSLGGNQHQLFDGSMHTSAIELIQLEGELKRAVERTEWLVQYQPIVSLADGAPIGAEALVRWLHPQRGIIPPKEFMDVAEETGLIVPIGEHVMRTACLQAKAWHESGLSDFWVSVNVSGRQFRDKNLVDMVAEILLETRLPGHGLQLEITESVAIRDMEYTVTLMDRFNALGVNISLDDFGTGYSSLSYLKKFPLKVLKIDRSFIQDIQLNGKSESLITGIIAMARSLGMQVVAEGVEKEEQLDFLRTQQCDNVQGFLLGRPTIGAEFSGLLKK
jgi:diguanylate cyclase (GGDEF)-like protein